jgi:hypothetical protein
MMARMPKPAEVSIAFRNEAREGGGPGVELRITISSFWMDCFRKRGGGGGGDGIHFDYIENEVDAQHYRPHARPSSQWKLFPRPPKRYQNCFLRSG